MSDQELCDRIFYDDQAAFFELKKKHNGLVFTICKEKLEKGGLHTLLSVDYKDSIEFLSAIIWDDLYKQIKKGIDFRTEHAFKNLLRMTCKWKAADMVRSSLKNRKQGAMGGKNNTFPRISQVSEEELHALCSLDGLIDSEEDEKQFFLMLSSQLDQKELDIFNAIKELIDEGGEGVKKIKNISIANRLGISSKTVSTRMGDIKLKAEKIKEAHFIT